MKSKKIIALALTAAMAISMAGMSVSAKTVKYNTDQDALVPANVEAKVTVLESEATKVNTIVRYKAKSDIKLDVTGSNAASTPIVAGQEITAEAYEKLGPNAAANFEPVKEDHYFVKFGDLGLRTYANTPTMTFYGWKLAAEDAAYDKVTSTSIVNTKNWGDGKDLKNSGDAIADSKMIDLTAGVGKTVVKGTDSDGNTTYTLCFYALGWTATSDDDIKNNMKNIEDADSAAAKKAKRSAALAEKDAENSATNNVNTGKGVETKAATVGKPTAAWDTSAKNVDVFEAAGHDLKVAGVGDLNKSSLAWVYDVQAPDGLISGKNARVTLDLPTGYTTSGYSVKVWHVQGWCKAERVKNLDIADGDVTFWTNDFSPFVLVLNPRDSIAGTSTGNPSTGDFSAVPVAMLAAAALGATGFVAYKKRKAE